jgi:16S rRNA (cytosine967-C5)-methyltransferase
LFVQAARPVFLCRVGRFHSYINSAKEILTAYNGHEPFAAFLKKHFSANKKFGSKDRKQVAHLCYCYFRTAKLFTDEPPDEKLLRGLFLCSTGPNEILEALKPEWGASVKGTLKSKYSILNAPYSTLNLFPWINELSDGIDAEKFSESFLQQPDLFLRIRPGMNDHVLRNLSAAEIPFSVVSESCIALPNTTKLDSVVELNKEAVIQDYSSQRVGELLKLTIGNIQSPIKVWDCCAASGGKSILAKDIFGEIDLTVSDIRESILLNLKKRFREAELKKFNSHLADLSKPSAFCSIFNNQYSIIICDVPCTGSGTWARTPEQLYYFNEKGIGEYSSLQREIVSNVIPHLQPGGHLLYITCSVFKKENEEIMEFIKQNFHFELIKMEVLKGFDKKADTMFAALLRKSL